MKSDKPFVSVAMGVRYRKSELYLLKRSISSILDQTYTDFELLICDDGSSPQAMKMLEQLTERNQRIHLIRPGNCLNLAPKLNACIRLSKGTYIARMDDDDYSAPERFEKQVHYLEENRDVSFAGCNVRLYRGGKIVGRRQFPDHPSVQDFYFVQPFIHPALMFRKEALVAAGGYSEDKHQILCEDYDLLLRLYAAGYTGVNLEEELLDYTVPQTAKGNRRMGHRWNEAVTRMARFRDLGVMPHAFPYVVKPLAVGLIPEPVLSRIKKH